MRAQAGARGRQVILWVLAWSLQVLWHILGRKLGLGPGEGFKALSVQVKLIWGCLISGVVVPEQCRVLTCLAHQHSGSACSRALRAAPSSPQQFSNLPPVTCRTSRGPDRAQIGCVGEQASGRREEAIKRCKASPLTRLGLQSGRLGVGGPSGRLPGQCRLRYLVWFHLRPGPSLPCPCSTV